MASTNEPIALPLFANLNARRSRNMAAIKSKDTKPELFARSAFTRQDFALYSDLGTYRVVPT